MTTLRNLCSGLPELPMATAWYLSDLAEAKGRQQLFTHQAPQRLKALREHAMIESAVASNRIEGVEIEPSRVRAVVLGKPAPRDINEEEVRGYRNALRLIHESAARLQLSEDTVLELHRLSRGGAGDAGQYKKKDVDILETYPDGRSRVRFRTVTARRTPGAMRELMLTWDEALQRPIPPLVALAAVGRTTGAFRLSDLQRECPGVSVDMIRHVLKELRDQGAIECSGRGRGARWHRIWKWHSLVGSSIGPPCQVRQRFSGRVGGIRGNEKVTNLEAFGGAPTACRRR